jgi:hypothetical protein
MRSAPVIYLATALFIAGVFVGDGLRFSGESFRYIVGLTMQGLAMMALILNSKD